MPRRYLCVRNPSASNARMVAALDMGVEAPNIDEIIESQDIKLQEIKRLVFSGSFGPMKLVAEPPISMSSVVNEMPNNHGHMISTHYNNHEQSLLQGGGGAIGLGGGGGGGGGGAGGGAPDQLNEEEIDFSKAEAFLQLEAPIDARKDQSMLKLAYTIPKRTFMSRILRRYPIHKKRLAFIQRKPLQPKPLEVVGNLVVSAKGGGESKEVSISCQVCGQRFTKQHHFQRHLFMHPDPDNKKFLCQVCGKRFNRADHLNRHALLHGDVRVQKCLLCGEEFDRASHLDRHRRKHHPPAGQQPSQTPPLTPQIKSPPPMGGAFDGIGFVTNIESPTTPMENQGSNGNNLHLLAAVATPDGSTTVIDGQVQMDSLQDVSGDLTLLQTPVVTVDQLTAAAAAGNAPVGVINQPPQQNGDGAAVPEPERPYPCEVCGRKFIRSTHLRRHMRIHTGEKPFACHICGRRYARGDYLRAHIQAHRRDKIHKCKHCGDVFRDLTRFADHCRVLHKDMDDEHGNPKPPPENSPPPPPISTVLGDFLTAESAEEITVVPSSITIASEQNTVATPMMIANPSNQNVPITLINLADSQDELIISSLHHAPHPPASSTHHLIHAPPPLPTASSTHHLVHAPPLPASSAHGHHLIHGHALQQQPQPQQPQQHHHQLPTSMQAPQTMTSHEMQLAHLQQTLGAGGTHPPTTDHHQFLIPNNVPESANEVTVVSQLSKAAAAAAATGSMPSSYIDPITQYIISNGNANNSNTLPSTHPSLH